MTDKQLAGQGSIIPTLFIGLGGTGARIVDRIAYRARHLPNWESQLRPLTHFVGIDTNEKDQHKLREVPKGNQLNIAAFDKAKVIEGFRRSEHTQALQWLDENYHPREGVKPGAGQIRVESRLGWFFHSPKIRQRLRQLVQNALAPNITWRQESPRKFNVYVFCSLAGGTGSGSFLSVAYLVQDIIRSQGWEPRIVGNFLLSTLLTDKVGPELHNDIHANSYAALKELEHLTKLDYKQVKDAGRLSEPFQFWRNEANPELMEVKGRPFFLSLVYDRPEHVHLGDCDPAVGDAVFLQCFTPIMDNLEGELDNYEKRMEKLAELTGSMKGLGSGYAKNYGTMGAAALVLPGRDILDYCALRFAAEAIRTQITFGLDEAAATDDRARALAKLAVDYSDPRFLNMGDEGREKVINDAFKESVRELARQDERDELLDGYWYQLVESIERGKVTGVDDKGLEQRSESTVELVGRRLEESRQALLDKVSIKAKAFLFHRDGVAQYRDYISRLEEDIRKSRVIVNEGLPGIARAAAEGEVVSELKLNPVAERYLVLLLLEQLETDWIPAAEQQLTAAKKKDLSNTKVRDELDGPLYEGMQQAAGKRIGGERAFEEARAQAEERYRAVLKAAKRLFDAEIRLRQLRELLDYLRSRSRQYTRVATRMDGLVRDLRSKAERLRKGEAGGEVPWHLRVEVFETLTKPANRLWDRVYDELFVARGRYLSTFDREALAETITEQLKPVVRGDGRVVEKGVDQVVSDLEEALTALGRRRMRPAILGGEGRPGLDLARGLELEALLLLGEDATDQQVKAHLERKFKALDQLTGVMARVDSAEADAWDDGVTVNRTRQFVVGRRGEATPADQRFTEQLSQVLGQGGRQVKLAHHPDPQLAIVHDVELGIPLYYLRGLKEELEPAYLDVVDDRNRGYFLHTDADWEVALPNLNPRREEIEVGWSLRILAQGLVLGLITASKQGWTVHLTGDPEYDTLGPTLSKALYKLSEYHGDEHLSVTIQSRLQQMAADMDPERRQTRRTNLAQKLRDQVTKTQLKERMGGLSRQELLDRPVKAALLREVEQGPGYGPKPPSKVDEDDLFGDLG